MKKILAIYLAFLAVCLYAVDSETACESLRTYALSYTDVNNGTIGSPADSFISVSNAMVDVGTQANIIAEYIGTSFPQGTVSQNQAQSALADIVTHSQDALRGANYGLDEMSSAHSYFQNFDCGTCSSGSSGGGSNDCCVSIGESLSTLDSHMTSYFSQIRSNQEAMRALVTIVGQSILDDLGIVTNQLNTVNSNLHSSSGQTVADLCYFMLTNLQPMAVACDQINLKLNDIQSALKINLDGSVVYVLPEIYRALDNELVYLASITNDLGTLKRFFTTTNGSGYKFFSDYKNALLDASYAPGYTYDNLFVSLLDHTSFDYGGYYEYYYLPYLQSIQEGFQNLGFSGDWSFLLESLNFIDWNINNTLWGRSTPFQSGQTNLVKRISDDLHGLYLSSTNVIDISSVTNLMQEIIEKQVECINANSNFFNVAIGLYTNFNDSAVVDSAALLNYTVGGQINYQYYSSRPWFERIEFLLQYANGNVSQSSSELESSVQTTESQVASYTNALDSTKSSFYDITNTFGNVYASASTFLEDFQAVFEDNLPQGSANMVFTFYSSGSSDSRDSPSFIDSISIDTESFVFRDAWTSAVNISRDLFVILWGLLNVISSLWLLFRVAQFTVKTIIINGLMRFSHSMIASKGH